MSLPRLTPDRFQALIDAYGARPSHWPEDLREAMSDLVAREAWARACVDEADRLDALMDAAPILGDAGRVRGSVLAAAPKTLARVRLWRWIRAAGLGIGLATSAASGLAVGMVVAPTAVIQLQDRDEDALQEAAAWIQSPDISGQSG
jgi:hypothetical protein